MKRAIAIAAIVALLPSCERQAGRIGKHTFHVDYATASAQSRAQNKPLFIEFWADN
jgi:hypothetical protein